MTKKFTHAELAEAQAAGNWTLLWQQAMPLVKLVLGRMKRGNSVKEDDADSDLLQQGMLTAGEALREWKPMECAFSTHICNAVRWKTYEYLGLKHNGGIGSHKQKPAVLSTEDSSNGCSRGAALVEDRDDGDGDVDGSFNSALTYEGVVRGSGQYDGMGVPPEGYGDPADEASKEELRQEVESALDTLPGEEQELVRSIHGWGRFSETREQYAARVGVSVRTVTRRLGDVHTKLARRLRRLQSH